MKKIKQVAQSEVFNHWEKVEKISITQRADVVFPLVAYSDVSWQLVEIEKDDIIKIYIISSDDWKSEGVCIPDFKLLTAITNYGNQTISKSKYENIKAKETIFSSNPKGLDTKLILVAPGIEGPFSIIEGNHRSIALGSLNMLEGLEVYLGTSAAITNYIWSRHNF